MPILTASEVSIYCPRIVASAITIAAGRYIDVVQKRLPIMTNNYFCTELYLRDTMTFYPSALTIVANNSFENENFAANDDIFICYSYRNDGYFVLADVDDVTLTLASEYTIYDELSGASILISIVKWPEDVKQIAAQMVWYDCDIRGKRDPSVRSHSMGPFSESFSENEDAFGYPKSITDPLMNYRMARLM